jgi:hypothetical protein
MSNQILVLKTSLAAQSDVEKAGILLDSHPQIVEWNTDLEDCDRVLRVECIGLTEADIVDMLQMLGYEAEKME